MRRHKWLCAPELFHARQPSRSPPFHVGQQFRHRELGRFGRIGTHDVIVGSPPSTTINAEASQHKPPAQSGLSEDICSCESPSFPLIDCCRFRFSFIDNRSADMAKYTRVSVRRRALKRSISTYHPENTFEEFSCCGWRYFHYWKLCNSHLRLKLSFRPGCDCPTPPIFIEKRSP